MTPETPQNEFSRELVRGWITDALNEAFGLRDTTPDTLVVQAQRLGLTPEALRLWIYEFPKASYTPGALAEWAARRGIVDDDENGLRRAVPPEIPTEEQQTR